MRLIRRALARVSAIFRGHAQADHDLRAEMDAHLEMAATEYMRRGMRPEDARRRALVEAGGMTQATERSREARGLPWLETFGADARYAIRHFRRTPLATVTMILVLSLGLGASVVLFTVVNSVVTLPPPGITPDDALVRIRGTMRANSSSNAQMRQVSWPEVQAYMDRTELFAGVAATATEPVAVSSADASSVASATVVYTTANYYGMLGIRPAVGALPAPEPSVTQLTTSPTAMISHAMWMRRFGGSPDVIGQSIRINDVPVQIVGVAPERFLGTGRASAMTLWVPLAAYPLLQKRTTAVFASADSMFLSAFGQLRQGVAPATASPIVASIAARVFRPGQSASAMSIGGADVMLARIDTASADVVTMLAGNYQVGDRRDTIISAAASGGFVLLILLITCTNVSALMVGLASARRREIGVRLSLGAPRERLVRQLLTESVLLALIAASVGLLATAAGIRVVGTMLDDVQLVVDWRVTLATCAVAIATGILFGLSPALHATRVSIGEVLKSSASAVAATRSRLQRGLVVAQVALTQPLLVGLGVGIVTMASDAGTATTSRAADRIVEIEIDTWAARATNAEREARIAAAVERIGAMPGVVAAMPMQMGAITMPLAVHPSDRVPGVTPDVPMRMSLVSAPGGYFGALGIPLARGRDFNAAELKQSSTDGGRMASFATVIVGSDLAKRLWGDANPLGRRLMMRLRDGSSAISMTVVGVVDAAAAGPSEVNGQVRAYVPYSPMNTGVIVRTAGLAEPMLGSIRDVVTAEARQMPVARAQTMEQREADAKRAVLRASGAVAAAGLLALLLSAIGLYAVVSFAVGQRTREIGIRTALGASSARVVRMFFANGLGLGALGLAIGLPLSMVATPWISSALNWPLASSPLLGVAIGGVVLAVASLAAWIPARRASAIDPIIALRSE